MDFQKSKDAMINAGVNMKCAMDKSVPSPQNLAFSTAVYCAITSMFMALAADYSGDVISGITTGLESLWDILTGVATPIAAIALAACAVAILYGNQQSAEKAKGTVVRIIIGIGLVYLAPTLVGAIRGWFDSTGNWSAVSS